MALVSVGLGGRRREALFLGRVVGWAVRVSLIALVLSVISNSVRKTWAKVAAQDSSKAATVFGITEEEVKTRMDGIWSKIDYGQKGTLGKEDFREWLEKVKRAVHQQQADMEVKSLDKNGDGLLSFEELEEASAAGDLDISPEGSTEDDLRNRFNVADKNKDKLLDKKEVVVLLTVGVDDEMTELESFSIIKIHDSDGDGKISKKEFLASDGSENQEAEEQMLNDFAEYDTNSDGYISAPEIAKVLKDTHVHDINASLEEVMKVFDGEETITKALWDEHVGKLSTSPISDNGEILRYPESYNLDLPFNDLPPTGAGASHDEL